MTLLFVGGNEGFRPAEQVRDRGECHWRQLDQRQLFSYCIRGGQRRLLMQYNGAEPGRRRWLRWKQLLHPMPPLLVRHMRCYRGLCVLAWLHQRRLLSTVQRQRRVRLAAAVCHLHGSGLGCAVRPQPGRRLHVCRRLVQHKLALRIQLRRFNAGILQLHRSSGRTKRLHWGILRSCLPELWRTRKPRHVHH